MSSETEILIAIKARNEAQAALNSARSDLKALMSETNGRKVALEAKDDVTPAAKNATKAVGDLEHFGSGARIVMQATDEVSPIAHDAKKAVGDLETGAKDIKLTAKDETGGVIAGVKHALASLTSSAKSFVLKAKDEASAAIGHVRQSISEMAAPMSAAASQLGRFGPLGELAAGGFEKGALAAEKLGSEGTIAAGGLAAAGEGAAGAGTAAEEGAGGLSLFKTSMLGVGIAGLAMVGTVAATGAASIGAAQQYQQSTALLSAQAQISQSAAAQIGQAFVSTAGKTTFSAQTIMSAYAPVAGEFGQVQGHALSASQALQVMQASSDLAEASGQSLSATTKPLADTMMDFGLKTAQAGTASDTLFEASSRLGVPVSSLTSTFDRMKGRIAGSKLSLQQMSALMIQLAPIAGSGRQAIRQVGQVIQQLESPSTKAQGALSALGVSLTNSKGQFVGYQQALQLLGPAFAKATPTGEEASMQATYGKNAKIAAGLMNESTSQVKTFGKALITASSSKKPIDFIKTFGQNAGAAQQILSQGPAIAKSFGDGLIKATPTSAQVAAQQLFGRQANIAMQLIAQGAPGLAKYTAEVNKQGAAQKAAETASNTYKGSMEKLEAALLDAKITIGTALLPLLTKFVAAIAPIVGAIAQWIGKHQQLTLVIMAAVGILGTLLVVVAALSIAFAAISAPVLLIVAGLALLTAGVILAVTHWKQIEQMFERFGSTVAGLVKTGIHDIGNAFSALGSLIQGKVTDAFNGLKSLVTGAIDGLKSALTSHWQQIVTAALAILFPPAAGLFLIITHFTQLKDEIGSALSAVRTLIVNAFTTVKDFLGGIFDWLNVHDTYWHDLVLAWDSVKQEAQTIWNAISAFVRGALSALLTAIETDVALYKTLFTDAWDVIRTVTTTVWGAISSFLSGIWTTISGVISAGASQAEALLSAAWTVVQQAVTAAWQAIVTAVSTQITTVVNLAAGIGGRILSAVGNLGTLLFNAGVQVVQGLISGITSKLGALASTAGSIAHTVGKTVLGLLGVHSPSTVFQAIGVNVALGFQQGIVSGAPGVATAAGALGQSSIDAIRVAIADPGVSKKALGAGSNVSRGFASGITSAAKGAASAAQKIANQVTTYLDNANMAAAKGETDLAAAYTTGAMLIAQGKASEAKSVVSAAKVEIAAMTHTQQVALKTTAAIQSASSALATIQTDQGALASGVPAGTKTAGPVSAGMLGSDQTQVAQTKATAQQLLAIWKGYEQQYLADAQAGNVQALAMDKQLATGAKTAAQIAYKAWDTTYKQQLADQKTYNTEMLQSTTDLNTNSLALTKLVTSQSRTAYLGVTQSMLTSDTQYRDEHEATLVGLYAKQHALLLQYQSDLLSGNQAAIAADQAQLASVKSSISQETAAYQQYSTSVTSDTAALSQQQKEATSLDLTSFIAGIQQKLSANTKLTAAQRASLQAEIDGDQKRSQADEQEYQTLTVRAAQWEAYLKQAIASGNTAAMLAAQKTLEQIDKTTVAVLADGKQIKTGLTNDWNSVSAAASQAASSMTSSMHKVGSALQSVTPKLTGMAAAFANASQASAMIMQLSNQKNITTAQAAAELQNAFVINPLTGANVFGGTQSLNSIVNSPNPSRTNGTNLNVNVMMDSQVVASAAATGLINGDHLRVNLI